MKTITIVAVCFGVAMAGTGCKKDQSKKEDSTGTGTAASAGSAGAGSTATGSATAGSATAGSAGPAADTAEPAKTCSATAWKEKSGLFCVDAPGFAAGAPEDYLDGDGVRIYFKRAAADGKPELTFTVTWSKKTDDANAEAITAAANMESDFKNNKGESQGKFAGGKGRYFVFARKDDDKSHKLYTVVNGKQHAYNCEASSYGSPIAPELIEGCKSLIPTD
jgi:hypothetical protein